MCVARKFTKTLESGEACELREYEKSCVRGCTLCYHLYKSLLTPVIAEISVIFILAMSLCLQHSVGNRGKIPVLCDSLLSVKQVELSWNSGCVCVCVCVCV